MTATDIYLLIGGVIGIIFMIYAIIWQEKHHKKERDESTTQLIADIDNEAKKVYDALKDLKQSLKQVE